MYAIDRSINQRKAAFYRSDLPQHGAGKFGLDMQVGEEKTLFLESDERGP
jgi:hypothetical protein